MASPLFPESLNLLYDGKCSVCQWEVENLMSLGGKGRIAFTDIESPDFDPTDPKNGGVSYEAAMGKITAVTRDGDVLVGGAQLLGGGCLSKQEKDALLRQDWPIKSFGCQ